MKKRRVVHILSALSMMVVLASCGQKETTSPVRETIDEAVFASGYMVQENSYTVSAKVEGLLITLPVKEGDSVTKKEVIAIIDNEVQHNQLEEALAVYQDAALDASPNSPQLQQLQVQIKQARQQLEFDKNNFQRYEALYKTNSVSQLEFEQVELQYQTAQSNLTALQKNYQEVRNTVRLNEERSLAQVNTQRSLLNDYQLTTEEAGQVIHVYKKQGELVRRGEAIAQIGSGAYLIRLLVAEDDITKVELGQPVTVSINTYPDQTFAASITKIYPGFDKAEQSYIVEARFKHFPPKLFSGTQLQANIATGSRQNVLLIPTDYLSGTGLVTLENGEQKRIKTGTRNKAWTEVTAGLTEQDVLVKPNN